MLKTFRFLCREIEELELNNCWEITFIDQISKFVVRLYIEPNDYIEFFGGYFALMNVENSGAFLGMGSNLNPLLRVLLLLVLPVLVLGFVLRYVLKDDSLDRYSLFSYSSIIGGGIANVFDRIVYGSVTDFMYIRVNDYIRTGVFNMADLSVTTGIIILVFVGFKNNISNACK